MIKKDIDDWNIAFVETGLYSNITERLLATEMYLAGEEAFLVNYTDALMDRCLPEMIQQFTNSNKLSMLSGKPNLHRVSM